MATDNRQRNHAGESEHRLMKEQKQIRYRGDQLSGVIKRELPSHVENLTDYYVHSSE